MRRGRLTFAMFFVACLPALNALAGSSIQRVIDSGHNSAFRVVSKAQLTPPLLSQVVELRFSPDGRSVLLQDESIVNVIGLDPPKLLISIPGAAILPARFSEDSRSVILATADMGIAGWSIADDKLALNKTLGTGDECFSATLSSHGRYYACLDRYSILHVFATQTGEEIYKALLGQAVDRRFPFVVPYHREFALSQPFGYRFTSDPPVSPFPLLAESYLSFSPDNHYLVALDRFRHAALIDLQSGKSLRVSGKLRGALEHDAFAFGNSGQIVAANSGDKNETGIFSLPNGSLAKALELNGTVRSTENPAYVIHTSEGDKDAEIVDLRSGKPVVKIAKGTADVWENKLVYCTQDGVMVFARIGEARPDLELRRPLSPLPTLRTAAVSPGLKNIALGITGQAGVFNVATGARRATFTELRGGWCETDQTCLLELPGEKPNSYAIKSVTVATGEVSDVWSFEDQRMNDEHISSGPVILSQYLKDKAVYLYPNQSRFPYELQGFAVNTGKMVWSRPFGGIGRIDVEAGIPLAFTGPQGERIVLGWPAKSGGARHVAELSPLIRRETDHAKLSDHDSVFEVLAARTGKFIGAALVQTGAGPDSFSEAFSAGNWLVLALDGRTVIACSLSTGVNVLEQNVENPALSGANGLLSVAGGSGKLLIYGLETNTLKDQLAFPAGVAYSHFSADGKHLLVLTQDQMVYVVDVSGSPDLDSVTPKTQVQPGSIVLQRR